LTRMYPKRPMVGVGALIIRNGEILLERRGNRPGKGKWSIPGGLVELGETAEKTVVREVKEETGLDVEKPRQVDVVDNIELDGAGRVKYHFVIIDYLVTLKSGRLRAASDATELRWVSFKEVENYDLTSTFRAFFERSRERLERLSSIP
jgi:8-oxo-dGTP diphosphatase